MDVFGCLEYYRTSETKGDKFKVWGGPGIFLGYPLGTKGYNIFNIEKRKIVVSRDTKFHEDIFPFPTNSTCENDELVDFLMINQPILHSNIIMEHKMKCLNKGLETCLVIDVV